MHARLDGDHRDLSRLISALRSLANVPAQISKEVCDELNVLVQRDEFDAGKDPYGRSWAKLKASTLKSGRRAPPLTNTRHMRRGTKFKPMRGAGIEMTVPFPGRFHQKGTSRMVARKPLPDHGLPAKWAAVIRKAWRRKMRQRLSGRG